MPSIKTIGLTAGLSLLGNVSRASAHGFVSGIVIGGEYYPGFNPGTAPFQISPQSSIGWQNDAVITQHIPPQDFGSGDIICHLNASPAMEHATVAAGSSIDLQWTEWPEGHRGPVLDYMARCDGECEQADKYALEFFKIAEAGRLDGSSAPGTWASDELRANNNTWTVEIPASIAPGNYVLRHEIISLELAILPDGAQNYPQCINLQVTGSGTENPAGIPATEFYTPTDPGIAVNIYNPMENNYTIPGPPLYDGAASGSNSTSAATPTATNASSSAVPSMSTPASEPITSAALYARSYIESGSPAEGSAPFTQSDVSSNMTVTSMYQPSSSGTDEMTSTTTVQSIITLTTTVQSGDTTADGVPATSSGPGMGWNSTTVTSSDVPMNTASGNSSSAANNTGYPTPTSASLDSYVTSAILEAIATGTAPNTSTEALTEDNPFSGMSFQQFLDWLQDAVSQFFGSQGSSRQHARDLDF